jgi:phosphoserine aminotransferase
MISNSNVLNSSHAPVRSPRTCSALTRAFATFAPARTSPVREVAANMAAFGRVYNFSAGPAVLPIEVLQEAQADLLNYGGSGTSVMEMSHRSKAFEGIIKAAEADLRTLLSIPDNYKVLFLQGGASTQFATLVHNLTAVGDVADYVVTGAWSKKAYEEGLKVSSCNR